MTTEQAMLLAEVDSRSKSNTHRINELGEQYKAINRIATAVEIIANEQKHQTDDMKDIKTDVTSLSAKVETIEHRPAKKAEAVIEKVGLTVVGVIAGAAAGALLAYFGI